VLDLACRTGAFSRKLAEAGAKVLGIEGKNANFDQIPATAGTEYLLADVRNIGKLNLPQFDVILCLGLMYHFEACDVCELLHDMRARIKAGGFVIVDTHVGGRSKRITIDGVVYNGDIYNEGVPGPWSSLGNDESFWFSEESLHHLCRAAGWSVEVLPGPDCYQSPGRHWMVLS
jgi:SAM-dependent methyltransferase